MNVLHLYDGHETVYEGRGSVPNVVWNLARETARLGHRVEIIERQWAGLPATATREGVQFRRLPLRTGAAVPWEQIPYEMVGSLGGAAKLLVDRTNFAVQVLRELRTTTFDLLHVHLPFAANVIVTLAPWLRGRMVYTAHIGETEERLRQPKFSPDAYLADRLAQTIVLNPTTKAAFESRGVSSDRLTVIPNGVDTERFQEPSVDQRATLREQYDIAEGLVVLFVGTVTPRKGVTELVSAAADVVSSTDQPVQFVIVGKTDLDDEYMTDVRRRVEQTALGDDIVFTGFVPDEEIPVFYDLADVFVLPSYEEGSSIAVTEAIASATPVVGTRIDGIRQQIDDELHGRLVDPGDIEELTAALIGLLDDAEKRVAMSQALADRAESLSWPRLTERIVDVYAAVDSPESATEVAQ